MKFFLMTISAALLACHTLKPGNQPQQGISGFIYRQSGNQMPAPNRPARKPKGIACELYVFQPTTIAATKGISPLFSSISSHLVTIAHSDSTGHYSVSLPTGKYSVFLKEAGGYYANESDGEGFLNVVEVVGGKITVKDFGMGSRAVY